MTAKLAELVYSTYNHILQGIRGPTGPPGRCSSSLCIGRPGERGQKGEKVCVVPCTEQTH